MDRLISEKSVMEVIYGCDWFIDEEHAEVIKERIKAIPSAESCEDAISREAVLEKADYTETEEGWCGYTVEVDYIKSLPPVTPQSKIGHWIEEDMFDGDVAYRCSECDELFWIESGTPKDNGYDFCPKCGKRMVEPQEGSE